MAPKPAPWKKWFTLVDLLLMLLALCFDYYPPEAIVLFAEIILWMVGILNTSQALAGFGNPGLVTVAALFVVVGGAAKSPLLKVMTDKFVGDNPKTALWRQMILVTFLSAWLNNTPLVAFFTPIFKDWARSRGFAPSQYLIPLSYSAIMGGVWTSIGTSTNLVVQSFLKANASLKPLSFFELGYVGVPLSIIGIIFCCCTAKYLLPHNKGGLFRHIREHGNEFITELVVEPHCQLVGQPILRGLFRLKVGEATPIKLLRRKRSKLDDADEREAIKLAVRSEDPLPSPRSAGEEGSGDDASPLDGPPAVVENKVELRGRDDEGTEMAALGGGAKSAAAAPESDDPYKPVPDIDEEQGAPILAKSQEELFQQIYPITEEELFRADDRVVLEITPQALLQANFSVSGANFTTVKGDLKQVLYGFVEVVISNSNPFIGTSLTSPQLQQHYDATVIAARKNGVTVNGPDLVSSSLFTIETGDTLLLSVKPEFYQTWAKSRDFFVVSKAGQFEETSRDLRKEAFSLFIVLGMFVIGGGGFYDMELVACIAACVVVGSNLMSYREAIDTIEWGLVVMIGAALGIGKAMETSGLAETLGGLLRDVKGGDWAVLFVFHLLGIITTELVSNNASAAVFYPIGIATAKLLKCSSRPFIVSTCIAASAGFALPMGYQTHIMVMGPGGYVVKDFLRIGVMMDVLYLIFGWVFIGWFFPFRP